MSETIGTTFLVYHHKSMDKEELTRTIESYKKQMGIGEGEGIEIILLLDGILAYEILLGEEENHQVLKGIRIIGGEKKEVGPGKLWNEGAKAAFGKWIVCTWTGTLWHEQSLAQLRRRAQKNQTAIYGPAIYSEISDKESYTPKQVGLADLGVQSIAFANSIPLGYLMISKDLFYQIGGFREELEAARIVDWEFVKRLSERVEIEFIIGGRITIKSALNSVKFEYDFNQPIDKQIRALIVGTQSEARIKTAIVAGLTEGAQVQLCLLNYFERVPDEVSYRRFLESDVKLEELEGYDRIFLVRSYSAKGLDIVQFCLKKKIKIIYLLDDNWFCMTKTYPLLERQMGKESRAYLYFILIISLVDQIWVYNQLILEDMKAYNPNVCVMPINISLKDFKGEGELIGEEIRIGFAGSASKAQHFEHAFRALKRILEEFENVKLYFKGIALPNELGEWTERVVQENYNQDYKGYIQDVMKWQCEIMLSPLVDTRYINSKCANKYLEITALGAAGIYTDIPLYQSVIENGKNGLLIQNEEEAWYEAIKRLIRDKGLREQIKMNAYRNVEVLFDTDRVLDKFLERLLDRCEKVEGDE